MYSLIHTFYAASGGEYNPKGFNESLFVLFKSLFEIFGIPNIEVVVFAAMQYVCVIHYPQTI